MANRTFRMNWGTLVANPITIFCNFGVGAAGAVVKPTTANVVGGGPAGFGPGILNVVHTGTGVYTITLSDTYPQIIGASAQSQQGTATQAQNTPQSVSIASITQSVVVLNCTLVSAGTTLADPANGIQIQVEINMDNTTMPF